MASPARIRLPAIGEQLRRPKPALAWVEVTSPTAAPRPRQPSIPRGDPCAAARALQCAVLGRPSAGRGDALPRFDALGPLRVRRPVGLKLPEPLAPWTIDDLPELQRLVMGVSGPRPGNSTSGRRVAEAFTAPELPKMEPAASAATSGQTSDTESTSDLSERSPSPGEAGTRLRRTSANAREDERPPSRRRQARPTSATSTASPFGLSQTAPPTRPRGEVPGGARPGCAGRSMSARGSRLPRSSGA